MATSALLLSYADNNFTLDLWELAASGADDVKRYLDLIAPGMTEFDRRWALYTELEVAKGGLHLLSTQVTLRQQANQLVVEYAFFGTYDLQPRLNFTFKLDGSESRHAVMIGHAESVLRSRVAWRDTTLVITTIYPTPPGTTVAEMRQSLTLASPTTLIVETTRGGIAGTTPAVIRTVYAKR